MKSALNEVRRARPLLGTFVDITTQGADEADLHNAIDHAFAVIERVHRLMSFYDLMSDVGRTNRDAFRRNVIVHPWTWCVLNAAQRFARESDGVFDVTAAHSSSGNWRDVVLEENRTVRFRRSVSVDLGGIAKGFAVDRAVETLKKNNVISGIVNAGGDIRVFGSTSRQVHLRSPASPTQFCGMLCLRNRAVATSAIYFMPDALIDGRSRRGLTSSISVTVAARDCMTADALTKIVFALRERVAPLLKRYRADALILDRDGSPGWTFHTHAA